MKRQPLTRIPPKKLELHLLKCPTCRNYELTMGGHYKSIPSAADIWCSSCKKWFVVEWPFNDKGPTIGPSRKSPGVYVSMNTKIYNSVEEYTDRKDKKQ